jgi:hypothetical protein
MSLTQEQIDAAAPKFVDELVKAAGGPLRSEADLRVIGSPTYKPFYRACAIFVGFYDEARERLWGDANAFPTVDQAMELLSKAHPWFAHAIVRETEHFKTQFGMHVFGADREDEGLIDPEYIR